MSGTGLASDGAHKGYLMLLSTGWYCTKSLGKPPSTVQQQGVTQIIASERHFHLGQRKVTGETWQSCPCSEESAVRRGQQGGS